MNNNKTKMMVVSRLEQDPVNIKVGNKNDKESTKI